MPGRNYSKVEAKYNVTTDFPSLGLHSAAASGNLGLVEYALGNGQPINSVLDGVLPLHAACAGGHIHVVKLLIERGADVNAPRLPRRYSNDKNRDSTAPIVGSSGSTPLHFAAANGNTNVVNLLLLHGAHADLPDKHAITPEKLALQNGWLECAQVLKDWIVNKDRDLRERETVIPWDGSSTLYTSRSGDTLNSESEPVSPPSHRRRLQVKHSIDTALNMLKSSSSAFDANKASLRKMPSTNSQPPSPVKLVVDPRSDSPSDSVHVGPVDQGSRCPSLPQSFPVPPQCRKASIPSSNSSPFSTRRPRSAGTGAEQEEEEPQPRSSTGRRLGSKYSLINMFRKAQSDIPLGASTPDIHTDAILKPATSVQGAQTPSHLSVPRQPTKPGQDLKRDKDTRCDPFSRSPPHSSSPRSIDRRNLPNLNDAVSEEEEEEAYRPSSSPISLFSSILRTKDNNRERSGSNGSSFSIQNNKPLPPIKDDTGDTGEGESNKANSRPSILRGHNRTLSSGQGTPLSSSHRVLRFEYSLDETDYTEASHALRSVNSAGPLVKVNPWPGDASQGTGSIRTDTLPVSAPANVSKFESPGHPGNGHAPHNDTPPHPPTLQSTPPRRIKSVSSFVSTSSASSVFLLADNNEAGSPPQHLASITHSSSEKSNGPRESVIRSPESATLASSGGSKSALSTAGLSGRSAFEIDIRSISSHAQAEALVHQTQKEILELGEQDIILSDGTSGSIPFSARLAAYGESLALERKLREEMVNQKAGHSYANGQRSPSMSSVHDGHTRLIPTRAYTDTVVRQHSLDEKSAGKKERYRQMHLQPPGALDPYLSVENANADQAYSRPATSLGYTYSAAGCEMLDDLLFSGPVTPVDSLEQDPFATSQYPTSIAPLSGPIIDRSVEQARTAKLTKMGFAPSEQASRLPPVQAKSFSGLSFRNIMQTFKGKS